MDQTGTNSCSICPNLISNERGGLAIYENAIGVHVKHISTIFERLPKKDLIFRPKAKVG